MLLVIVHIDGVGITHALQAMSAGNMLVAASGNLSSSESSTSWTSSLFSPLSGSPDCLFMTEILEHALMQQHLPLPCLVLRVHL